MSDRRMAAQRVYLCASQPQHQAVHALCIAMGSTLTFFPRIGLANSSTVSACVAAMAEGGSICTLYCLFYNEDRKIPSIAGLHASLQD